MPSQGVGAYSPRDLLGIAKQLETTMEAFYRGLAEKYPERGEMFSAFAEEEAEHIQLASTLIDSSPSGDEDASRISEVMAAFEQSRFLPQPMDAKSRLGEITNMGEAMRASSDLERRVELFYCHIAPSFEASARRRLYDLIVAEHRHRVRVEEMMDLAGGCEP